MLVLPIKFVDGDRPNISITMTSEEDSILDIKIQIQEIAGIPVDSQQVTLAGRSLLDHKPLKYYKIVNNTTMWVKVIRQFA